VGRKAYATRVDFEMVDFKYRYLLYYGRYNDFFGKRSVPGLAGAAGKVHLLPAGRKTHIVGKQYADHKIAGFYRDYHGFRRASNYNKAGKCPGRSYGECLL
jgi:hypothetical protein